MCEFYLEIFVTSKIWLSTVGHGRAARCIAMPVHVKTCTGTAIHRAAWPRPTAESQILGLAFSSLHKEI